MYLLNKNKIGGIKQIFVEITIWPFSAEEKPLH